MSLHLGIDGGGTQTRAVIVDHTGQVLGVGAAGPANHRSIGVEAARLAVFAAQAQARHQASIPPDQPFGSACLGLAGCGSDEDVKRLRSAAPWTPVVSADRIRFESDLRIAHAGAFEGEPGLLVIAGTGSACLGVNDKGVTARAGGWGPMFDDRGSAFDLGRMAIMHTLRAADGREEASWLSQRITDLLGGDLRAIAGLTAAGDDRTRIAALAPVVFESLRRGESVGGALVRIAVEELARLPLAVATKLEMHRSPLELVLVGGLNHAGRDFFQTFYDALRRHLPLASIVSEMLPPVLGAAMLAMRHAGLCVDDDVLTTMRRTHQAKCSSPGPADPAA